MDRLKSKVNQDVQIVRDEVAMLENKSGHHVTSVGSNTQFVNKSGGSTSNKSSNLNISNPEFMSVNFNVKGKEVHPMYVLQFAKTFVNLSNGHGSLGC